MKLSIFTTVTNPLSRGDLYHEALRSYKALADEVVVVNGGQQITEHSGVKYLNYKWPEEFDWPFIGQQFTRGYKACTGDWVIRADIDMLFHESDFEKIRQAMQSFNNSPALSFYKYQFILPDRYNLKSRLVLAVNKGLCGDRVKLNSGRDLCQPSLNDHLLSVEEMPQAEVPVYNYEKLIKTKAQIMEDQGRMDRAYKRHFGHYQLAKNDSDKSAYDGWLGMQRGRFNKPAKEISLNEHPKHIRETIQNLKPNQWGYSGFDMLGRNHYA